ncbi:MAG TPA: iron-sulfur cluster assembly scaffold protein [Dehalococcoidia bacterium]|nr:iron-sulfur cluster assembly scaffold protein [Dehalococcoidia bacterium]
MSESYSDIVLDHAQNPRNQGSLEDANARAYQMNPVCGDVLALTVRIDDGRISAARFQTEGCTASVATSSILTEMITGLTLDEAEALTHEDISEAVGGLPASKLHSAALVIGALKQALAGYKAVA